MTTYVAHLSCDPDSLLARIVLMLHMLFDSATSLLVLANSRVLLPASELQVSSLLSCCERSVSAAAQG